MVVEGRSLCKHYLISARLLLCRAHHYNEALQKKRTHQEGIWKLRGCYNYFWFSLNPGSWHLFNLLLLDYVAHIFQSYIEEEEEGEESFCVTQQSDQPVLWVYEPSYFGDYFAEEEPQAQAPQSTLISLMLNQSDIRLSNVYSEFWVAWGRKPQKSRWDKILTLKKT